MLCKVCNGNTGSCKCDVAYCPFCKNKLVETKNEKWTRDLYGLHCIDRDILKVTAKHYICKTCSLPNREHVIFADKTFHYIYGYSKWSLIQC